MIKGLLKKLGLGPKEAAIGDAIASEIADRATGGAASEVDQAVGAVAKEIKRRKAAKGK